MAQIHKALTPTYNKLRRRKCKCAPSYLCARPTNRYAPKTRLHPADVSCLRRRRVGAHLGWEHGAAPID